MTLANRSVPNRDINLPQGPCDARLSGRSFRAPTVQRAVLRRNQCWPPTRSAAAATANDVWADCP
jgi:hypothetical protein